MFSFDESLKPFQAVFLKLFKSKTPLYRIKTKEKESSEF